jgi:hypothetical protein
VISPLLANIYLHYVLDEWFETDVKPRLKGKAYEIRFADDFILCFQYREDAECASCFGSAGTTVTVGDVVSNDSDFAAPS